MSAISTLFWLVIYLVIFTPLALIYRLMRPDPLRLKQQPAAPSYWQVRRGHQYARMTGRY